MGTLIISVAFLIFYRELEILKCLNHPNVLRIRDSFFTY